MTKLHLDTDIGGDTDDLCALVMLLKWSNLQITGLTTVCDGNGRRAGYAKYALKVSNREDVIVKAGAGISGGYYSPTPIFPNEKDYWLDNVESSANNIDEALELLRASVEQGSIIVAIGPYTNLCLLDVKYPGILKKAELFLMGGHMYPAREGFPPWGHDMDWNIQVDPKSAKYVLENSDPILIPLSVTVETALRKEYLPALRQAGALGELLAMQAEAVNRENDNEENLGKAYAEVPDDILNFQHDSLACAIALGWNDGVEIQEVRVKLEMDGKFLRQIPDSSGRPLKVVIKIDGRKFNEFWLETVTRL